LRWAEVVNMSGKCRPRTRPLEPSGEAFLPNDRQSVR
jgi:hypothetical protein